MTENKEISSTEKLLDLIRSDSEGTASHPPSNDSPQQPSITKTKRGSFSLFPTSRDKTVVGVDIGVNGIRLVKTRHISDKKWSLLDYKYVPFKGDISKDNPKFQEFLKRTLSSFCQQSGKLEIWTSIASAHVNVRYLLIPKVSKKQLTNTIFWTFKQEASLADDEASCFDYEIFGEVSEKGVKKTAVVAFSAPQSEIKAINNLYSKCGFSLSGITASPFGIQNLFQTGWIKTPAEKTICNLYVGRDWSRIDVFSEGQLVLTRGVKTGINSMAEELMEGMKKGSSTSPKSIHEEEEVVLNLGEEEVVDFSFPEEETDTISLSLEGESGKLEESSLEEDDDVNIAIDKARSLLLSLGSNESLDEHQKYKEDELLWMIQPAIERLIKQVERTLEHYSSTFSGENIGRVYISGKIEAVKRLVDHIGEQLHLPVEVVDPLSSEVALFKGTSAPRSISERVSYALATGFSLSDNLRTPNFLYTRKEKEKKDVISRIDRTIFVTFILLLAGIAGLYFWQGQKAREKEAQIDDLSKQLALYSPEPTQDVIRQMAESVKQKQKSLKEYSNKYRGMAAISELTALTPDNINMISSTVYLGQNKTDNSETAKSVVLDGIISGERHMLEAIMAGYLVKLASSPLFDQPNVLKSDVETYGDNEVLRFTINLGML